MGKQYGGDNRQSFNNKPRGGGNFRGGPGGRGGRPAFDQGPPSYVIPYCVYLHKSENTFVVKCTDTSRVPKFNRGLYLENKTKVGSVDQIFGPINNFYFSIKPAQGVNSSSFKEGQLFYMNPEDLLSMDRFINSKPQGGKKPAGGRPGGFNKGGPGGFNKGGFNKGGPGGFNKGGPGGFKGGPGGFKGGPGGFKGKR